MELQEALKFVQDNRFYGFNELVLAKGFKKNTVVLALKHGKVNTAKQRAVVVAAYEIAKKHKEEFNRV